MGIRWVISLLALCLLSGLALGNAVVNDVSIQSVNANGATVDGSQSANANVNGGNVLVTGVNVANANSYCGPADVDQHDFTSVKATGDVNVYKFNVANIDTNCGGSFDQSHSVNVQNKGDTNAMLMNDATMYGNVGKYTGEQENYFNGYGTANNAITTTNTMAVFTNPFCSEFKGKQTNTKIQDPQNIMFYDSNDAVIVSGKSKLEQANFDTMGASESIVGQSQNSANVFAPFGSQISQENKGQFYSPGYTDVAFDNYADSQVWFGKNKLDQDNSVNVNTHPWGPVQNPIVNIGKYNTGNLNGGFIDYTQESNTVVT